MSKATVVKKTNTTPEQATPAVSGKEAMAQKAKERWNNYTPEQREDMLKRMAEGRNKTPEQRKAELLEQKQRWTEEHNERMERIDAALKRIEEQGDLNIEALLARAKEDPLSLTPAELGRLQAHKRKLVAAAEAKPEAVEGQVEEAGEAN